MDALKWALIVAVYLAMVVLCILRFDLAGIGGIAGSALGFVLRVWSPGQDSISERLGNGLVGLLVGIVVGFLLGAGVELVAPDLALRF